MTAEALRLLLVDDDPLASRLLKANLCRGRRARVDLARSAEEGLDGLGRQPYDALLTDLVLPGLDGIEVIRAVRAFDPSLPIFVLTAHATLERAVEGIRAGATDFLAKPVNPPALLALIERAVAERPLKEEVRVRLERQKATPLERRIVGSHPKLEEVRRFAVQVARVSGARVLLTGETGTGKSALARTIHDLSETRGRFVELNCASIPFSLMESELFGHERGAFTNASTLKRGLIEQAHEGTLLLDEIGALPVDLQAKLLLFLEGRQIRRVGGTAEIPISTRVIAATNEDLHQRVRERTFRADLLYRLDVATMEMPALRRMPEVVVELARTFTETLSAEMMRPVPPLERDSFVELESYPWPGNARELRNCVERALIFHSTGPLRVSPPAKGPSSALDEEGLQLPGGLSLEEVERRYLSRALEQSANLSLEEIARQLGISRKNLWEKRRRYDL